MVFLDCESAGLRGEIFAAAMIGMEGETIFDGFFRHPDLQTNAWIRENVEPNLTGQEYTDLPTFQAEFAAAYEGCREKYGIGEYKALQVVAHMGAPVESNFFQQLFEAGLIGEFSGPYPLFDTAPLLAAAGYDPTSEQSYASAASIIMPNGYKAHSALSDAYLTRLVWNKLTTP